MKKILYIFIIILSVSCSDVNRKTSERNYHIGVSQCSGGYWRDKQNNEMQRELLLHDNVTMELRCAEDDDQSQIQDIQYFIDKKVDALIISPNTEAPLCDIIGKAYDAGIPVILFDRNINSEKYTTFVGGDNNSVGEALATFTINSLRQGGNVIELMGNMNTSPAKQRHKGFIKTIAQHPEIKVLASVDARWDGPMAKQKIDSLFNIYPKVDVVVAHSDYMVSCAQEEIGKIRPEANIKYVGVDGFGSPGLGVFAVEKGRIDATVVYPTAGDVIMHTALDILEGKKVGRENLIPSHIVTTKKDAALLVSLNEELSKEVNTIMLLRDKVIFYNDQLRQEKTLIIFMIAFLVASIALILTLLYLNAVKKRSNEQLHRQQQTLTEQHQQLQQMTKELEAATNAKLLFFTNISHDFRTPLTLISSPVNDVIKLMENSNGSDRTMLRMLRIAQRNIMVLLDLVNQILDFRKIENGKMQLHLKGENLLTAMNSWLESFIILAQQKNINIRLQMEDGDWNVVCDIKKIERMIFNLIGNSIKFTPAGGHINMRCRQQDGNIQIAIQDNGIGIAPDKLEHIFDRFYMIEQSSENGSGIGLELVKSLVELMNGKIDVISSCNPEEGETGTTFTITLPLNTANPDAVEDNNEKKAWMVPPVPLTQETIEVDQEEDKPLVLIVDDNEDILTYLSALLSGQYRVITAENGEQGIKKACESIPDLIICDVMMPVMNGLECCHAIKTDVTTSHIPVLMLTACSLDEQRVKGLSEGAEAYISKPFNSTVLMAQIESLLKNRVMVKNFYSKAVEEPQQQIKEELRLAVEEIECNMGLSRYDVAFIEKLREIINDNLHDETFNVEMLSAAMCMSRSQLYRKCKALIGESTVELIRNSRLQKAKNLLSTTPMQIADVAKAVGIPDASYFTKCYKSYFGVLPSTCNNT